MQHFSTIITEILAGLCWEATRAFRGDEGGRKLRPLHPALGDVIPSKKENPSLTRPTGRGQKPLSINSLASCELQRHFETDAAYCAVSFLYLNVRTYFNKFQYFNRHSTRDSLLRTCRNSNIKLHRHNYVRNKARFLTTLDNHDPIFITIKCSSSKVFSYASFCWLSNYGEWCNTSLSITPLLVKLQKSFSNITKSSFDKIFKRSHRQNFLKHNTITGGSL